MPLQNAKTSDSDTNVLVGKEIFLRLAVMADLAEYTALRKKSVRLYRGLVNPFKGRAQFAAEIRSSGEGDSFRFFICRNDDRRIAGSINLFLIVRGCFQSGCISYLIGAPYARRGYTAEALQLLLRFAFHHLKLHRVEANIQPGNKPSLALVRRAGFRHEGYSPRYLKICGQWRDHERWALLAEDWSGLPPVRRSARSSH